MRKLAMIVLAVAWELLTIFAQIAPACAYVLLLLHDANYITVSKDLFPVRFNPNDRADTLIAMFQLFLEAMFKTPHGRDILASWVAVSIITAVYGLNIERIV